MGERVLTGADVTAIARRVAEIGATRNDGRPQLTVEEFGLRARATCPRYVQSWRIAALSSNLTHLPGPRALDPWPA